MRLRLPKHWLQRVSSAEVVDLRSLRPIDYDTVLASVQKTNRCVTIEEGFPVSSIGNHLSATIMEQAFDYLDAPVINCTGKDVPYAICGQFRKTRFVDHPRGDRGCTQSNLQVRKTELCQLKFSMPALSPTMEQGSLTKWLVKAGDTVASGRPVRPRSKRIRQLWNLKPSTKGSSVRF
jgi:hypothetical protein